MSRSVRARRSGSTACCAATARRAGMQATLPMETRARVRAVLADVRGLHLCVLFADGACELHCLSAASPPPVVLQRVSSAAFIPPALPNSAAVVACCVGHQLVLALSAAPRAGFVCARLRPSPLRPASCGGSRRYPCVCNSMRPGCTPAHAGVAHPWISRPTLPTASASRRVRAGSCASTVPPLVYGYGHRGCDALLECAQLLVTVPLRCAAVPLRCPARSAQPMRQQVRRARSGSSRPR